MPTQKEIDAAFDAIFPLVSTAKDATKIDFGLIVETALKAAEKVRSVEQREPKDS